LPEALEALRATRKNATRDQVVRLSACDPLNLAGILTPGERVPATLSNTVGLRDGVPLPAGEAEAIRHPRHRHRSESLDSGVSGASRP
jgi:ATP-dependent helicase Lhr and Lhr-like helicase